MSKPATYAAVLVVHPTTGDVLVRRWPNVFYTPYAADGTQCVDFR